MYGEQISLTYKGDSHFTTLPGAVTSLVIIMTLLAFAVYRMMILVTRDDPEVSKQSFMKDLDAEPALIPSDFGFEVAFGLSRDLDPTIGRYVVNTVAFDYIQNVTGIRQRVKDRSPVNITQCEDKRFLGFNQTKVSMYGIPKM
jgi:hypothetical protein